MRPELLGIMVCPVCKGHLSHEQSPAHEALVCPACSATYKVGDGIPHMLPPGIDGGRQSKEEVLIEWRSRMDVFIQWRARIWDGSERAGKLQHDFYGLKTAFVEFSGLKNSAKRLLDIGCGDGGMRTLLGDVRYYGLDPLLLEGHCYDFPIVKGVGERLPFESGSFDEAILNQVLDHCISIDQTFEEITRVTGGSGSVNVMQFIFKSEGLVKRAYQAFLNLYLLAKGVKNLDTKMRHFDMAGLIRIFRDRFEEVRTLKHSDSQVFIKASGWRKGPKVSVIIPTYNRKDYIAEAIDSVLNQTYTNYEIIVVDDGSTDGTGELLRKRYGDKIRFFYKENGGCASARNYGIREARGEYVVFLDSDDKYLPEKLADHGHILDADDRCDFVSSDIIYSGDRGQSVVKMIRPDDKGRLAYPLFIFTFTSLCACMFRRVCFKKAGNFNEAMRYNEDTDFLLRVAIHCRAAFSKKASFLYREHSGGKSTDKIKLFEAVYDSSKDISSLYPDFTVGGKGVCKRLGQIKLDLSLECMVRHSPDRALAELRASTALYPALRKRLYAYLIKSRLADNPLILKSMLFAELLASALKWRIYRYTGWIV